MLPLICRLGQVSRRDIGRVRVLHGETLFEVSPRAARGFGAALGRGEPGLRRLEAPDAG